MNTIRQPVTYSVRFKERAERPLKVAEPANDRNSQVSDALPPKRNAARGPSGVGPLEVFDEFFVQLILRLPAGVEHDREARQFG